LGDWETDTLGLSRGCELGYLVWVLKGVGSDLLPEASDLRFQFLIATFQRQSLALPLLKLLSDSPSIPIDRFPTLFGFPGVAADDPPSYENHRSVNPVTWKQCEVHQATLLGANRKNEKTTFCTIRDSGATRIVTLITPHAVLAVFASFRTRVDVLSSLLSLQAVTADCRTAIKTSNRPLPCLETVSHFSSLTPFPGEVPKSAWV
jgi:hypothetical protein